MALDPLLKFKNLKSFKRDLRGDEFAHCIARITIGWGNIEYRLFWLLQAIDMTRAAEWAALLFEPRMLAARKEVVRKQIATVTKSSYPKFVDYLEHQFAKLQSIQDRRNLIAHGFWFEGASDRLFKVQPLNIKKGTKALEEAVEVDIHFLSDLIQDMEFLEQGLASLSSEIMAHQFLKRARPSIDRK